MANVQLNPFQPGNPVPPGIFAGRLAELEQISRCIAQTGNAMSQNILVTGERGIGKTSIAFVAKAFAEGTLHWDENSPTPKLVTGYVSVQSGMEPAIVIHEGINELANSTHAGISKFKGIFETLMEKIEEVNVVGSGFKTRDGKDLTAEEMYRKAEDGLRRFSKKVSEAKDGPRGVCLIIDEVDRLGSFKGFSSFWKVLQEKLAADDCRNLMVVLVGMPEINQQLADDHESFPRTFTPIRLDRMGEGEGEEIIRKALEKGAPRKAISREAIERILFYSERYPHLIQEIGYSAFEVSQSAEISVDDVELGLNGNEHYPGSIERLGELFFTKLYNEIRRSENYKELLGLIANESGEDLQWVTRQALLNKFSKKKSSLDGYLQQLVAKQVIVRNRERHGEYRPISKMFRAYIQKILSKES